MIFLIILSYVIKFIIINNYYKIYNNLLFYINNSLIKKCKNQRKILEVFYTNFLSGNKSLRIFHYTSTAYLTHIFICYQNLFIENKFKQSVNLLSNIL